MPFLSRTLTRVTVSCPVAAKEKYRTSGGAMPRARLSCTNRARKSSCGLWIGFLNDLFYGPELYRRTGRDVNFFSANEKRSVVPVGSAGDRSGHARRVLYVLRWFRFSRRWPANLVRVSYGQ